MLARGYNHSLDLDLNLNTRSLFDFGPEKLPRLSSNGPQIEQQEITAYKKRNKTPLQTLHILNFFFFIILAFDVGAFQHVCTQVYFFLDINNPLV